MLGASSRLVPLRHVGHLWNLSANEHTHDLGGYQTAERPERDVKRQIEGETGEENGPRDSERSRPWTRSTSTLLAWAAPPAIMAGRT